MLGHFHSHPGLCVARRMRVGHPCKEEYDLAEYAHWQPCASHRGLKITSKYVVINILVSMHICLCIPMFVPKVILRTLKH